MCKRRNIAEGPAEYWTVSVFLVVLGPLSNSKETNNLSIGSL